MRVSRKHLAENLSAIEENELSAEIFIADKILNHPVFCDIIKPDHNFSTDTVFNKTIYDKLVAAATLTTIYHYLRASNISMYDQFAVAPYILSKFYRFDRDVFLGWSGGVTRISKDDKPSSYLSSFITHVQRGYYFYKNSPNNKLPEYRFTQEALDLLLNIDSDDTKYIKVDLKKHYTAVAEYTSELSRRGHFSNKTTVPVLVYNGKEYTKGNVSSAIAHFSKQKGHPYVIWNKEYKNEILPKMIEEFYSLYSFPEEEKLVSPTAKELFESSTIKVYSYDEFKSEFYEIALGTPWLTKKKNTVFEHTAQLDLSNIEDLIANESNNLHVIATLELIKYEAFKTNNNIKLEYHRSQHGRLYQSGPSLQMLPKAIRKKLLSKYTEIDIASSVYSIVYNYAKNNNYTGSMEHITNYVDDPHGFRKKLHSNLSEIDPTVTEDYVKTNLIAVAYGANYNANFIGFDARKKCPQTIAVTTSGYTMMDIPERLADNKDFQNLIADFRGIVKWYIDNHKVKTETGTYFENALGAKMKLERGTSLGKKLAHMYQALEVIILEKMASVPVPKYGNLSLKSTRNGIGLMLHDGIYVLKEHFEGIPDVSKYFNEFIKNALGYDLRFD